MWEDVTMKHSRAKAGRTGQGCASSRAWNKCTKVIGCFQTECKPANSRTQPKLLDLLVVTWGFFGRSKSAFGVDLFCTTANDLNRQIVNPLELQPRNSSILSASHGSAEPCSSQLVHYPVSHSSSSPATPVPSSGLYSSLLALEHRVTFLIESKVLQWLEGVDASCRIHTTFQ